MIILITGANGYVGGGLVKYLPAGRNTIIHIGFSSKNELSSILTLDLTDLSKTNIYIKHVRPDIIIHLAGNKDLNRCESDKVFSNNINYEITKNIVDQCFSNKIKLIYISSDYVFNGVDGPFHELSIPKPTTQYGKDKLTSENYIRKYLRDYAIIRTAGIFGLKNDFVSNIIETLNNKLEFYAYTNLKNNPTFIKDLISMLDIIIRKRHIGTFHCTGSDTITRYEFAIKVTEAFRLSKCLIIPSHLDLINDVRPPNLSMDCTWTYKTLGYFPKGIDTILRYNRNIWRSK